MNEIYIKIEGLNLYRIAQKLVDNGVFVSNLKLKKTYILFSINQKYLSQLEKICKLEKKKYYIVKNTKLKRFFAKIPYLLGSFIPFSILFAVFYVFHTTIFSINLSAYQSENFDLANINKILYNHNISVGVSKNNLSPKEIENIILKNADNISGCEVFYEGRNLNIVIFPAKEIDEKNEDIFSKYNAVITKVDVFAGDSKIREGDLVKEGDLLIKNNQGAEGLVFGKVYFSTTLIYNEDQEVFQETGNVFKTSKYKIASIIDIGGDEICQFKNYKLEKQSCQIIKNLFIPIVREDYLFKEVKIEKQIVPFSQVENEIKEKLKNNVYQKIPKGENVNNISYSVVSEKNYTRIDCFAEVEMSLI